MARNIDEVIKALPAQRRKKISSEAKRLAAEMIRHAESLEELRKAVGKTQTEVAQMLGVGQNAISQLESRADLYMSTLNKYVAALGHRLEITLVTDGGERLALPNFQPWKERAQGKVAAASVRQPAARASRARDRGGQAPLASPTAAQGRKKQ